MTKILKRVAVVRLLLASPFIYANSEVIVNPNNSHSYQRIDSSVTWPEANYFCKNNNAYLATITSNQENEFIYDNFVNGLGKEPWLGGTDEFNEGSWEWVTGEAWSFSNWAPGEPNDSWGNEDYLSYHSMTSGQWNDNSVANSFICEWDLHEYTLKSHCVSTAEDLHEALSNSSSNYADDEIRIVQGTYIGNFIYASNEFNELSVLGGYIAGCSNRVIDPSNTILDGNKVSSVLALSAPNRVANFTVEGLTLRNGSRLSGNGGGIYANTYGPVLLEKNIISNNNAVDGGGVYVSGNGITLTSNTIISNVASSSGGGALIKGNSILIDNEIQNNTAQGIGGGISINANGGVSLINNDFILNKLISGNPYHSYGGGMYISANNISLDGNTINGNEAHAEITAFGGGAEISANNVSLTNNSIQENKAVSYNSFGGGAGGGGLNVGYGNVVLSDNIVEENNISSVRSSVGAGVRITGDSYLINNNVFKNTATCQMQFQSFCPSYGGGVYLEGIKSIITNNEIHNNAVTSNSNESFASGGGVYVITTKAFLANNTFSRNSSSSYGGGASLVLPETENSTSDELYNNLFWDNISLENLGADLWIKNDTDNDFMPTPITLLHNNFDRTAKGLKSDLPITINSSNPNKVDPLFFDIENNDYYLQSNSPMIDAGYPSTPDLPEFDIGGTPRVLGETVDIGAYEYDDGSDPRGILTVNKVGTGAGIITSYPTGINCGTDCAHAYEIDMAVMLTATPNANVVFDGWSGNDDCADGSLTMDSHKQCTATFSAARQLTINKTGEGNGTITSNPIGINCGSSCSAWFFQDALVQLTAEADSYSIFSGWTGAADCTDGQVTMATDLTCSATFDQIYYTLMVLFPGTGSGTVTSSPAGIDCGTDCREDYAAGTSVTLTATAAQGSVFNGWAGACSGKSPSCEVEITDLTGVTANFTALETGTTNTLYVTSTGGGTVTSTPIGITCGTQCDADYDSANIVTLTPTPNTGLTFNGWRGACSGTSTCQVPMTLDKAVMAAFGNTYPSQILLLQQEQLVDSSTFAAPRLVVLGPDLTIAAGSNTTVEAGEQIKFLPGFKVEKNATFNARINPTLLP